MMSVKFWAQLGSVRRTARENVELLARDAVEGRLIGVEVLREDLLRNMCQPIRQLRSGQSMSLP